MRLEKRNDIDEKGIMKFRNIELEKECQKCKQKIFQYNSDYSLESDLAIKKIENEIRGKI
jgi:hypothetical protein